MEMIENRPAAVALATATRRALGPGWNISHDVYGNFVTHEHPSGWRVVVGVDGSDMGYWRLSSPTAAMHRTRWPVIEHLARTLASRGAPDVEVAA